MESPEKIDTKWFERLQAIPEISEYKILGGKIETRRQQRADFFANKIEEPNFKRLSKPLNYFTDRIEVIDSFRRDLLAQEKNKLVRDAYLAKLEERRQRIEMFEAIANQDQAEFSRLNSELYGEPIQGVFIEAITHLEKRAQAILSDGNEDEQRAATELVNEMSKIKGRSSLRLPAKSVVSGVHQETIKEFGKLIAVPDNKKKVRYEAVDIKDWFERALREIGAIDWKVVIEPRAKRGSLTVGHRRKTVYIPSNRSFSTAGLPKLVLHEIGTHVYRRLNGEKSQLGLLGLGLARSSHASEGIATMREQAYENEVRDYSGLESYLAISFAAAVDGRSRSFRETFIILEKIITFLITLKGFDQAVAKKRARNYAWYRLSRVWGGLGKPTTGLYFSKDLIYRQGNINIWKVLADRPEEIKRLNIGRYDPSNLDHIHILDELGIE